MAYDAARILVVDDDQAHGKFLEEELSRNHCKATWIRDPRQKAGGQARR